MVKFIVNNGTQILFKKAGARMEQIETRKTKKTEIMSAVSKALTSIYTGMFYIDLLEDEYSIVNCPDSIVCLSDGIFSAQQAINTAIQNTVVKEDVLDVLTLLQRTLQ